jgi:hypothetical protein
VKGIGKMCKKQLVSSARQRTCTSVLAKHNVTASQHSPYSSDLPPLDVFLFSREKSVLKGRIHERRGIHCRSDESNGRDIEKMVSRNASKCFMNVGKVYHCPKEIF